MKNIIKTEIRLAFRNKYFYFSLIFMSAFALFALVQMVYLRGTGFDMWREFRLDENGNRLQTLFLPATGVYYKWIGGDAGQFTTSLFYFLVFLICTIPFSWSLVSEKQSCYEQSMVVRAGKYGYYLSKYIASFVSGAFVIVVPLIINFVGSACFVPAFMPQPYALLYSGVSVEYLWGDLYCKLPLLYVGLYILLAGVMAGLWATVGVSISFLSANRFVVMICPYLFLLFFHVLWRNIATYILKVSVQLSPIYFILPREIEFCNNGFVILLWIAVILAFDFLVLRKKGIKADVL